MSGAPPTGKLARGALMGGAVARLGGRRLLHKAQAALGSPDPAAQQAELGRILFGALNQLKGTALKAAQLLSLDLGLLPEPLRDQLGQAHYQARPLNRALVIQLLRREFGAGPEQLFAAFNPQAFAAASFGQVHEARSLQGERIAVKLQYPGMAAVVASDMRLLRRLLGSAAASLSLQLPPVEVLAPLLADIELKLAEELDYRREAAELDWFAAQLQIPDVRLPRCLPALSSGRVLSMQYLDGLHVEAWLAGAPAQAARDRLGQLLWDSFMAMLRLRRIQADPHPGNYLCLPGPQLGLLDFGRTLVLGDGFHACLHGAWAARRAGDDAALLALYQAQGLLDPALDLAAFRRQLLPMIGGVLDWQLLALAAAGLRLRRLPEAADQPGPRPGPGRAAPDPPDAGRDALLRPQLRRHHPIAAPARRPRSHHWRTAMSLTASSAPRTPWIGRWLLAVAALHTLFGLLAFPQVLQQLWQLGVVNSVGADPLRGAVVWFLLFGAPLALLAWVLTPLERRPDSAPLLRQLGWGILLVAVLGIVLMPASGFWLVLPAAIALIRRA